MDAPIGINFLPSAENQQQGPQQATAEGDLSSAIKILSLHLPRLLGAKAFTPGSNLTGQGTTAVKRFDPNSAIFEAIVRAMLGGGMQTPPGMNDSGVSGGLPASGGGSGAGDPFMGGGPPAAPRIGIGIEDGGQAPDIGSGLAGAFGGSSPTTPRPGTAFKYEPDYQQPSIY